MFNKMSCPKGSISIESFFAPSVIILIRNVERNKIVKMKINIEIFEEAWNSLSLKDPVDISLDQTCKCHTV